MKVMLRIRNLLRYYQIHQHLSIITDHVELSGATDEKQEKREGAQIKSLHDSVKCRTAECTGRGKKIIGQQHAKDFVEFLVQTARIMR